MAYTLYTNGVLEKDEFYIPIDENNPDYQEYVAWVALGNTPASADASIYLAKLARKAAAGPYAQLIPDWATMTADQAATFIHDSIFSGKTLAQVDADIDALPATVAGMRTGLHSAAAQIVTIRTEMEKMAKLVAVMRDELGWIFLP